MAKYTTPDIRNIAMTGSASAGKTTLVERMLHAAGEIGNIGTVENGDTVCDFEDLEKEYTHGIDSAIIHFDYNGAHVNIIDTPGSPGFLGKAIAALPAVETQVIMIDAASGIDTITRKLFTIGKDRQLPQVILINKIDHAEDLDGLLGQIQNTFGTECRPVNLPSNDGKGVIECFTNAEGDSDLGDVADFHTGIVDQVVEVDEELMEAYLEQGEVSPEQLHGPFEAALRQAHLVPVMFMSPKKILG